MRTYIRNAYVARAIAKSGVVTPMYTRDPRAESAEMGINTGKGGEVSEVGGSIASDM